MLALLPATAFGVRAAADTVTLRDEAYVKGPTVFLGDVADVRGENAEVLRGVEIAPAALPGNSKRFSAALLRTRLEAAGVPADGVDMDGPRMVEATTLSLEVTPGMIADDLRRFILAQMPWDPDDATIDLLVPSQDFVIPDGDVLFRWRPHPQYRYLGSGAIRGEILVDGEMEKTILCKATVEAYGDVVVTLTDIPRGKAIAQADLALEKRALSTLRAGTFNSIEEVVGQVARTTIFPGQVLTARNLSPKVLVKRNQVVLVEVHQGALVVRTRARARTEGRAGDLITCINLDSKEEFQGLVGPDGVVTLE